MKLCECGCGLPAPIAKATQRSRGHVKGEPIRFILGHVGRLKVSARYRSVKVGGRNGVRTYEHIRIVEQAIGKRLPRGAQVHHVDGDTTNNARSNLVACQDAAYHRLLHRRQDALAATGNPNWLKCVICKKWDEPAKLTPRRNQGIHPECSSRSCREWRERQLIV